MFQEFGKPATAFDIVVGDSQWLGRGATKGLYVDLTGWLPGAADLKGLHPLALKYLAEYPTGSGHYYAAPAETDAMGWAYRKDWFDDPAEKAAFKKKYKRELAVPETWDDLKTIAEFFTRPDKKRYGNVLVTGRGYDDIVMGFEQVLYAFGGAWGDPKTMKVQGALDSAGRGQGARLLQDLAQVRAARRQQAGLRRGARAVREQLVGDADELLRVLPGPRQEDGRQGRVLRDAEERLAPLREPGRPGVLDLDEGAARAAGAGQEVHRLVPPGDRPSRNG